MRFVDEHKDRSDGGLRWGVEPICVVLSEHHVKIAPATYYAAKTRPASARAARDARLKPIIERVHRDNYLLQPHLAAVHDRAASHQRATPRTTVGSR